MLKNKKSTPICISYKGKKIKIKPFGVENLSKYGLTDKDEAYLITAHSSVVEKWVSPEAKAKAVKDIKESKLVNDSVSQPIIETDVEIVVDVVSIEIPIENKVEEKKEEVVTNRRGRRSKNKKEKE